MVADMGSFGLLFRLTIVIDFLAETVSIPESIGEIGPCLVWLFVQNVNRKGHSK